MRRLVLAAWALGIDLQSQGPLLVHAFGGRVEEAGLAALVRLLGEGKLPPDAWREVVEPLVRFLVSRERGLERALPEEIAATVARLEREGGGCYPSRRASRLRDLGDAQAGALALPYPQRWDRLFAIEEEGKGEAAPADLGPRPVRGPRPCPEHGLLRDRPLALTSGPRFTPASRPGAALR